MGAQQFCQRHLVGMGVAGKGDHPQVSGKLLGDGGDGSHLQDTDIHHMDIQVASK